MKYSCNRYLCFVLTCLCYMEKTCNLIIVPILTALEKKGFAVCKHIPTVMQSDSQQGDFGLFFYQAFI